MHIFLIFLQYNQQHVISLEDVKLEDVQDEGSMYILEITSLIRERERERNQFMILNKDGFLLLIFNFDIFNNNVNICSDTYSVELIILFGVN